MASFSEPTLILFTYIEFPLILISTPLSMRVLIVVSKCMLLLKIY